jgi:hypothetical protein
MPYKKQWSRYHPVVYSFRNQEDKLNISVLSRLSGGELTKAIARFGLVEPRGTSIA